MLLSYNLGCVPQQKFRGEGGGWSIHIPILYYLPFDFRDVRLFSKRMTAEQVAVLKPPKDSALKTAVVSSYMDFYPTQCTLLGDMLAEKKKLEVDEKHLINTLNEHKKLEKRLTQIRDPQYLLQLSEEKRKILIALKEQD